MDIPGWLKRGGSAKPRPKATHTTDHRRLIPQNPKRRLSSKALDEGRAKRANQAGEPSQELSHEEATLDQRFFVAQQKRDEMGLNIPIEILFEIVQYLNPRCLLQLMRTCSTLARLLTTKLDQLALRMASWGSYYALKWSVSNKQERLFRFLLENGIEINNDWDYPYYRGGLMAYLVIHRKVEFLDLTLRLRKDGTNRMPHLLEDVLHQRDRKGRYEKEAEIILRYVPPESESISAIAETVVRSRNARIIKCLCDNPRAMDASYHVFYFATYRGDDPDLARVLVAAKIDLSWGVYYAVVHDCLESLSVLLDAGASTSIQTSFGRTPLHVAFCHNPDAIPLLLGAGADRDIVDGNGLTPLQWGIKINGDKALQWAVNVGDKA